MHNRHYLFLLLLFYVSALLVNERFTFLFFCLFFSSPSLSYYVSNMCEKNENESKLTEDEEKEDFFRSWSYDDNDDQHLYSISMAWSYDDFKRKTMSQWYSKEDLYIVIIVLDDAVLFVAVKMLNSVAYWSRRKFSDRPTLQKNGLRHTHYLSLYAL